MNSVEERLRSLNNESWLRTNEDRINRLFPDTWTHTGNMTNIALRAGFQFKLLGIDWRSETELAKCLAYVTKIGMVQVKGELMRRNPFSIFDPSRRIETVAA